MSSVEDLVNKIVEKSPERVFIQLPEGLIVKSQEILSQLYEKNIEAYVSLEPCFGACDLRDSEAERLGCDLLVNVGHSDFGVNEKIDTLYYWWQYDVDVIEPLKKNIDALKDYQKIGLVSSINFTHKLPEVAEYLKSIGKEGKIGHGSIQAGQVLGCNVSSAFAVMKDVDCFLHVGSGMFHPLGVGIRIDKPFLCLDIESSKMIEPDFSLFERQKMAAISKAMAAEKFAILVSTKPGQGFSNPSIIKKRLEEKGKKAWIFVMNMITPEKFEGMDIDCLVNTACPRIPIENRSTFKQPMLNPDELLEMLRLLDEAESAEFKA